MHPIQFAIAQFHPKKALSQLRFFDIEYLWTFKIISSLEIPIAIAFIWCIALKKVPGNSP